MPLERRVLEVGARLGSEGTYGFALAQELAGETGETSLVSHGTLYKALDRLRREGLLDAEWEDAADAADAGRPRRRIYRITAVGRAALVATDGEPAPGETRLGPAQA